MNIIKANEVLWHAYRPPLKGTFNNKEVNDLVRKPYKRVSLKETVKTWLTAAVAIRGLCSGRRRRD